MAAAAAKNLTSTTLELGGKSSSIPDCTANIEEKLRTSTDDDEVSDAGQHWNILERAGQELDTDLCGTSAEESEENVSNIGGRALLRRHWKEKEDVVDMNSVDGVWAKSLKGPHLDLMVSLKHLAEVRLTNSGEDSLWSCFPPATLRLIGIILEETLKDRMGRQCPSSILVLNEENKDVQPWPGGEGSPLQGDRLEQGVDGENGFPLICDHTSQDRRIETSTPATSRQKEESEKVEHSGNRRSRRFPKSSRRRGQGNQAPGTQ